MISTHKKTWWLFCRVIDNFGDIGVCFRLARQLVSEYQQEVVLWVDDLQSFKRLCPEIDTQLEIQSVFGLTVVHWQDDIRWPDYLKMINMPDVLIEAFACYLPDGVREIMVQNQTLWLNLEYLSAESWVEGVHMLPSVQGKGIKKYFFFPGFSVKTGGLLRERDLLKKRAAFLAKPAEVAALRHALNIKSPSSPDEDTDVLFINAFVYPNTVLSDWIHVWQNLKQRVRLCVSEGVASGCVGTYFKEPPTAGAVCSVGNVEIRVLPFVAQDIFDRVLWQADINIIRGEDSFVRAHWAAKPFFWHIYPQEEQAHELKLHAFWARAYHDFEDEIRKAHALLSDELNGVSRLDEKTRQRSWMVLLNQYASWKNTTERWVSTQEQIPDLTQQLAKLVKN